MSPSLAAAWAALAGLLVGHGARRAAPYLLSLRRKDRPFRWPWVELAGALAFAAVASRWGLSSTSAGWLVFASLLVAIAACDVLAKIIPDTLSLGGVLAGVAWSALSPEAVLGLLWQGDLLDLMGLPAVSPHLVGGVLAAWGAAFGFALLEVVRRGFGAWAGVMVMGMGDSKMLAMIGAFLGPLGVLLCLFTAFFVGAFYGLLHLVATRQHHSPFGLSLAVAGLVAAVAGDRLVSTVTELQLRFFALPLPLVASAYAALVVVLFWFLRRLRSQADTFQRMIDEDYERIEEELE